MRGIGYDLWVDFKYRVGEKKPETVKKSIIVQLHYPLGEGKLKPQSVATKLQGKRKQKPVKMHCAVVTK